MPCCAIWPARGRLDYYHRVSGRFERCSLENIDEICCSYSSLQGLLAELFLYLYEDGMEDACLYAWASQFGFHEVARMLVELQSDKAMKDYARWRTSWGASCVDAVR